MSSEISHRHLADTQERAARVARATRLFFVIQPITSLICEAVVTAALYFKTRTSTRFSHRTTLSASKQASFCRVKLDIVVILVRGFAKMLWCQVKNTVAVLARYDQQKVLSYQR